MQGKQSFGELTFGFDIGIASVGWAVLNEKRIVDLGVRCFDAAEDPEDGTPYNQKGVVDGLRVTGYTLGLGG